GSKGNGPALGLYSLEGGLTASIPRLVGAEFLGGFFDERRVYDAFDGHAGFLDQLLLLEEHQVIAQAGETQAAIGVDRGRRDRAVDGGVLDEGVRSQDRDDFIGIGTGDPA